jgi:hypothetical protein
MRTDRWMRVGRVVTAAAIGGSIMRGARAHASSDGYVTVGAGMFANEYTSGPLRQLAGGGERVITGHFGGGSDGSLVAGGGDVQLAVALNASGHVRGQRRPFHFDPFVRGGYTRLVFLSEAGGANALHIGGGFNYWFAESRAVVAEVRAVSPLGPVGSRYWLASVGVAFK